MSNGRKLAAAPVICASCGLPFGSEQARAYHWKTVPASNRRVTQVCLAPSQRGLYKSRGAWRLPR